MLAARIAFSAPEKSGDRAAFLEAHKAHLRNAGINIIQSGPFTQAAGPSGALVIAEVDNLEQLQRFSDADPFVRTGVYAKVHIVAWTVTIGRTGALT